MSEFQSEGPLIFPFQWTRENAGLHHRVKFKLWILWKERERNVISMREGFFSCIYKTWTMLFFIAWGKKSFFGIICFGPLQKLYFFPYQVNSKLVKLFLIRHLHTFLLWLTANLTTSWFCPQLCHGRCIHNNAWVLSLHLSNFETLKRCGEKKKKKQHS